jgi:ATP-dependent DNA helicase RecG
VYDNKLMLWNPGQLPPDWSLERLLGKHSSEPANPDIANTFFRAGKIESWGRGIDLIRNTCLEQGYPAPQFRHETTGLWVEFPFPVVAPTEVLGVTPETSVKNSVKNSVKTPVEILRRLEANPAMTLAQVAAEINKTPRTVELAASRLVKEGKLRHVGPQKGGHWEVL